MRIGSDGRVHLTYCLNVHPGETWAENFQAIREHALAVKQRICPDRPFGLGLRLGDAASRTLAETETLGEFRAFLDANDLYVFTVNGFPFGPFHGRPVKADVYAPDWRTPQRRDYTIRLAEILAALLPEGVDGTISTVPGSYRSWISTNRDLQEMVRRLTETARALVRIHQETGRHVCLALEPEPDCILETAHQGQQLLTGPLRSLGTACWLEAEDLQPQYAAEKLADHIGLCLDAAHAAVSFEDMDQALKTADVRKLQLSSALALEPDAASIDRLLAFDEPTYLHQVKVRRPDGSIRSFPDISPAVDAWKRGQADGEWRVHFHVPLFFAGGDGLAATSDQLTADLLSAAPPGQQLHLEIETYTWSVLPADLQPTDIVDGICREFSWAIDRLGS
jgi:sugar phosphate isomerase/epimerase